MHRALVTALSAALAAAAACHNEPEPQKPTETVPLPSSTGTPVGFLIDGKDQLHLTDDQVGALRNIDRQLQDDLKGIDTKVHAVNKAAGSGSSAAPSQGMGGGRHRGGGMGGGGMGGGGMGGGGMGRGGGGGGRRGGGGSGAPANAGSQLGDQRGAIVHDALVRSLAALDASQQPGARGILSDHDIDLDTDHPATPAGDDTPGYGGAEGEP